MGRKVWEKEQRMKNPLLMGKGISLDERVKIMKMVEEDAKYAEKRANEIFEYTIRRIHYHSYP